MPRLATYDYHTPGAYFVTAITQDRQPLFATLDLATAAVLVTDVGQMIDSWWLNTVEKFRSITLDAYVIMPDHFHGIVLLGCNSDEIKTQTESLSDVMHWFKTMTTAEYFRGVGAGKWKRVRNRLWQRGFYDRILRDEAELRAIRRYIECNPAALWEVSHEDQAPEGGS